MRTTTNPLSTLIDAMRDAYLQHQEAAGARRLHKLRARMPEPARRKVSRRRTPIAPPVSTLPAAVAPEPPAAPAPVARQDYPQIARRGYAALRALLADIDAAAADASRDGERMVEFRIGRTRYRVRQTFERLAAFRRQVLRYKTAFSDNAIA